VKGLGQRVLSRIILRNLLVLRAPSTSTGGGGLGGAGAIGNSITFAITDDQAAKLFFAVQNTSWSLVLRPVAKPSDSPESVQTIQGLVGAGLSQSQVSELTAGQGTGSIGNGQ
jgi:Flp pilus assembly protein CpaB